MKLETPRFRSITKSVRLAGNGPGTSRAPSVVQAPAKVPHDQGMSQSEAMRIVTQAADDRERWPPGSCGAPVENVDVKLVDDSGRTVDVGEHGECWVRPKEKFIIFNGYFDDIAAIVLGSHFAVNGHHKTG